MSLVTGWDRSAIRPSVGGWQSPVAHLTPRIVWGGLELTTSWHERPVRGAAIVVTGMTGWDDTPRDEAETVAHPTGDGVVSGLDRYGARTITVTGFIDADSIGDLQAAKDRLKRVRRGTFGVDERVRAMSREVDARRISCTFPMRVSPEHETFELVLLADDPVRYSTATQALANGANTLINPGDERSWPVLDVTGPTPAFTITHPDGTWSFAAVPSGRRVVDLRNGDVWSGDVRVHGVDSGPAPVIPAEQSVQWTIAGLTTGALRARRIGAWS